MLAQALAVISGEYNQRAVEKVSIFYNLLSDFEFGLL
jgi:hypothetical protein